VTSGCIRLTSLSRRKRQPIRHNCRIYRVAEKLAQFLYALTLPNINRLSKLFQRQNQEKICNKILPYLNCVATLLCEMTSVLKATTENKTTSLATHFKKLTTGNNVLIVSKVTVTFYSFFYIICSMCPSCCWTTHS